MAPPAMFSSATFGHQLERELGLLPVLVDDRDDLGVRERPNPVPYLALLVREKVVQT
jgi:hypothetical protein